MPSTAIAFARRASFRRHSLRASAFAIENLETRRLFATITVTDTGNTIADDGLVTLREALTSVNANADVNADVASQHTGGAYLAAAAGADTIAFNIPGTGVQTISVMGELPVITDPVTINGTTQPGFNSTTHVPIIELDGSAAGGSGTDGLSISADNCTIRGLVINRFMGNGIRLESSGNTVVGNYIGLLPDGATAAPNLTGVFVDDGFDSNRIGGTTAADRNVISGNVFNGVAIAEPDSENNRIEGNYIGTDATGTKPLGNGANGVQIRSANNIVGGTASGAGNLISANGDSGISIASFFNGIEFPAPFNAVQGNRIGTDVTGTLELGNKIGIDISTADTTIGGATPAHRNIIGGNSTGIQISGSNTRVLGNYIGTDVTGNDALLGKYGVVLTDNPTGTEIGGAAAGEGNVINTSSGPGSSGILIQTGDCLIRGNYIGTNAGGTAKLTSGQYGIRNVGGPTTVGGSAPGERNIISGWTIGISTTNGPSSLLVLGNFIGTDVTGTVGLGNAVGIESSSSGTSNFIVGGAAPGEGNLISGNDRDGIFLNSDSLFAEIYGNRIGTNVTGKLPLGNGGHGIASQGIQNFIGGFSSGSGNIIAFNAGNGVTIYNGGTLNQLFGNSIFSNVLLGIDLGGFGLTPNDAGDADEGANDLVNTPVLSAAFTNATGVAVTGVLPTKTALGESFYVQFFASPDADPSGFGEGKTLLGTIELRSVGLGEDIPFAVEFPVAIPAGQVITATATGSTGTSEFSKAVTVIGNPPRLSINDITVNEGNGVPVSATFTISMSDAVSGPVKVDFATADGTAVAQGDYLSQTGSVTFNPGETTRTFTITVNPDSTTEGTETFVVNLSNASIADIADGQGVGTILEGVIAPPVPPAPNGFSINDIAFSEGNSGTKQFVFTVTRGGNTSGAASVKYKTSNQTAGEGDYNVTSGTLSFTAGQTSKTISIGVKGDTKKESDETFRIDLSNASGATIADNKGIGTIVNDDGTVSPPQPPQPPQPPSITPRIFIGDASIFEGDSGTRTLTFDVTLEKATSKTVTLKYATQNGSAGEGDYGVKSGTITFSAGQTSKTIQITIKGDTKTENDEQFKVNLSNLVNATLGDGQATGTIKNDD